MKSIRLILLCAVSLVLFGCSSGDGNGETAPAGTPSSTAPRSADAAIVELYNRSCRSCHATGAARAPRTGDVAAWAPRMEQGMETLLDHTINGFQGMPPRGMCFDCSDEQFRALIRFMSGTAEG